MAIKANVTIKHLGQDITFKDAYIRVYQVEANKPYAPSEIQPKPPANSRATVMFYTDDTATQQIKVWHYMFNADLSPAAKNPWEQAYDFLKSLPEFEGAVEA